MHVKLYSGFRYFVIFVDNFYRITYYYLMKDCSELYSIFKSFYTEIKTLFYTSICMFRFDNTREYYLSAFS